MTLYLPQDWIRDLEPVRSDEVAPSLTIHEMRLKVSSAPDQGEQGGLPRTVGAEWPSRELYQALRDIVPDLRALIEEWGPPSTVWRPSPLGLFLETRIYLRFGEVFDPRIPEPAPARSKWILKGLSRERSTLRLWVVLESTGGHGRAACEILALDFDLPGIVDAVFVAPHEELGEPIKAVELLPADTLAVVDRWVPPAPAGEG